MAAKDKKPAPPPPSPSDDLVPRGNLPDVSVIKPGAGFGDDIPRKKPKKMRGGGSCYSGGGYVRKADGIAQRGKTRGKFV